MSALASLTTTTEKNDLYRFKQNYRIEYQTLILDVVEIVLKLLPCILDRSSIRIFDLRPARQTRRDQMTLFVIRNFFRQLRNKMRPFRPRSHEVHLTAKNIPALRYLVDTKLTNNPAHSSGAIVVRAGPDRASLFSINAHRAKFHHHKAATVLSHSFLFVENRSTRIELDQNGRDDCHR